MQYSDKKRILVILNAINFNSINAKLHNNSEKEVNIELKHKIVTIITPKLITAKNQVQLKYDEIYVDSDIQISSLINLFEKKLTIQQFIIITKKAITIDNMQTITFEELQKSVIELQSKNNEKIIGISFDKYEAYDLAHIIENSQYAIALVPEESNIMFLNKSCKKLLDNVDLSVCTSLEVKEVINVLKNQKINQVIFSKQHKVFDVLLTDLQGNKLYYLIIHRYVELQNGGSFIISFIENHAKSAYSNLLMKYALHDSLVEIIKGLMHSFKNIITNIALHIRIIKKKQNISTNNIQTIESNLSYASSILVNLSTILSNPDMQLEKIDLEAYLNEKLTLFRAVLGRKYNIQFNNYCNSSVYILGTLIKLEEILLNLLMNAKDAMKKGGNITIELFETIPEFQFTNLQRSTKNSMQNNLPINATGFVTISIKDEGIGISPKQQQHIFDIFYTTKEKQDGTGLGLNIVEKFVEEMYGTIYFESKENVGTTFYLVFPKIE